jgi:hypothetical protein
MSYLPHLTIPFVEEGSGGGGITLEQLQTELAVIKGEDFDPATDTLAKIAEGTGDGDATESTQLKILKVLQAQQSK